MKEILLRAHEKEIKIIVQNDIFCTLDDLFSLNKYPQIVILTDQNLAKYWLNQLKDNLKTKKVYIYKIPSGEKEKNIDRVGDIWNFLQKKQITRSDLIINLGGGVISDIGGFVASTYFRGISFLNIPTTLLSQSDASMGGKTGINFAGIKNSIGTFYQPIGVAIDPLILKTLPKREFYSGLGEVIKYALIYDEKLFNFFLPKNKKDLLKTDNLKEIIEKSAEIKASIVEKDELESGLRKILNFGHTVGHAIESLSLETNNPIFHGEAVGLGMLIESKISRDLGLLSEKEFVLIKNLLKKYEFSDKIPKKFSIEKIIEKINHDKKNHNNKVQWVLLDKIGKAVVDKVVDEEVVKKILTEFY